MFQKPTPSLYTAAVTETPWEAHILRDLLESEGVPAFIRDEHHVSVNWMLSSALGGVKVQVPHAFAERAVEVLQAREQGVYQQPLEEAQQLQPRRCAVCGSTDVVQQGDWRSAVSALASLALLGATFPPPKSGWWCRACGKGVQVTEAEDGSAPSLAADRLPTSGGEKP